MGGAKRVLNDVDRAVGLLSMAAVVPAAVCLVGVTVLVTIGVILRETALPWQWLFVDEYSAYALILIIYFGLAYTLRTGGHITVDVVARFLPKRIRSGLDAFLTVAALAMLGFFLERAMNWFTYTLTRDVKSIFPSLTPMWIPSLFVVLGLITFGLALLLHLVHNTIAAVTGRVEEGGEAAAPPTL